MIATEHETVSGTEQDCLHPFTICLDACGAWIVKAAAMNSAPEICVELEIRAAPVAVHGAKQLFEVPLHCRMRAVEHVPWTTTPAAKRNAIRSQRRAIWVLHKPIRMVLKNVRLFFSNE